MVADIIFFNLEFLYADTDSAESKIDKPIVAIIRMISIWSMRFILITSEEEFNYSGTPLIPE